jgi:hypothetical protein
MGRWWAGAWLAAGLALGVGGQAAAQTQAPAAPPPCTPTADLKFICGLKGAPEDLVRAPDSDWIIASGYVPNNGEGGITLIDPVSHLAQRAALGGAKPRAPYADCDGPPDAAHLSTHGLNLKRTGRGKGLLFAVAHGGREAIEVYDVTAGGKDLPRLTWVGCIRPAAGSSMNSVAPFADGRVAYTDFLHQPATFRDMLSGKVTGAVYVWTPGKGAAKVEGSDLPGPNGIEVTPDMRWLVVAVTGTSEVVRFDLKTPAAAPEHIKPGLRTDNLRWGPDGKLLMAGPDMSACAPGDRTCRGRLVVSALDPKTLKWALVTAVMSEPAFPALSVGLIAHDEMWLGTPQGERVAYRPLKP